MSGREEIQCRGQTEAGLAFASSLCPSVDLVWIISDGRFLRKDPPLLRYHACRWTWALLSLHLLTPSPTLLLPPDLPFQPPPPPRVIVFTSSLGVCSHALSVRASFVASPNNNHTVVNIVWRSLWPAVSGPAAQGSGSDAEKTHTHTHPHTRLV